MVGIAQLVRVPGCGPGGRGFESHYSPHFTDSAYDGVSPSGKAPDFDSGIRRFKSCHPSQFSDPLAQSVEHLTFNQGVRSSSLRRITIFRFIHAGVDLRAGVAELADAPDLGSGARKAYGFKSLRPHHTIAFLPAGVAHLVERSLAKAEVAGSSPVSRSIHKRTAHLPVYEWRFSLLSAPYNFIHRVQV